MRIVCDIQVERRRAVRIAGQKNRHIDGGFQMLLGFFIHTMCWLIGGLADAIDLMARQLDVQVWL